MPLPTLSHVAQVEALSSPTIVDLLTVLAGLTFTHWNVVSQQEDGEGDLVAVLLKPKAAAISDVRVIFAGRSADPTGVSMESPDTWSNSVLLMRVGKDCVGDALDDWKTADPLGSSDGTWMGFIHASRPLTSWTPTMIRVVETAETIELEIVNTTEKTWCEAGCRYRNASDAAGYETNGRLVGMATTGSAAAIHPSIHSTNTNFGNVPHGHHGNSTYNHVFIFDPGLATKTSPNRAGMYIGPTASSFRDRNGGLLNPPVVLLGDNIAVEARDIFYDCNRTDGQQVENDDTDHVVGIALSASGTSDAAEHAYLRRVVP